jgi:hypothetical protein
MYTGIEEGVWGEKRGSKMMAGRIAMRPGMGR